MKYQAVFASLSRAARLARRRLFVLLMALTMAAAVRTSAWSAGVSDIIWLESNSTAGSSILTFKNDCSGKPTFLGSTPGCRVHLPFLPKQIHSLHLVAESCCQVRVTSAEAFRFSRTGCRSIPPVELPVRAAVAR